MTLPLALEDRELSKFRESSNGTVVAVVNENSSLNPIPVYITSNQAYTDVLDYSEITSVPASTESLILSYTVASLKILRLKKVFCSGSNVAEYRLKINSTLKSKQRTFFGNLNCFFNFDDGITFASGDTISIYAYHVRPYVSDFNSTLIGELFDA